MGLIIETDLLGAMVEILGYKERGAHGSPSRSPTVRRPARSSCTPFAASVWTCGSLVTCAKSARPGYRDFVVRVRGEEVEELVAALRARYGREVSVLVT